MEHGSSLALIPFGQRQSDAALVDVADVPRGKACGCVCPSCGLPLVARQGRDREWHFAHATRGIKDGATQTCEFSFYVSVRLMARQLLSCLESIALPAFQETLHVPTRGHYPTTEVSFKVTSETRVTLAEMRTGHAFNGVSVDALATIRDYTLIIYLTHPGRGLPPELRQPKDSKCGVIAIALDRLQQRFTAGPSSKTRYRDILRDFLSKDLESKRWVLHPRYKAAKAMALRQFTLTSQPPDQRSDKVAEPVRWTRRTKVEIDPFVSPPGPIERKFAHLECVNCGANWEDLYPGDKPCPTCGEYMFKRLVNYL